ncbi:MAG TPA: response regulator [Chloroflexota bacterium]|jgi:pilus assembly protein CpaE|nr:response regulator [Chloroflexota bacterium]
MREHSVLVVEEASVVSDLIRDLLEAAGFSVVQTSTSKDALELLAERQFGVVLVDASMPKLNGYQVLEQIRTDSAVSDMPVLLMAPGDLSAEPTKLYGLTARDYVRKPIEPVDLIVRVREAIGEVGSNGATPPPAKEPAPLPAPPPVEIQLSKSKTPAKLITVFSLKGGVGTSTIAVNLAVALYKLWGDSTALADLSLEAGALNVLLDILPTSTLDELVAENGSMTSETVTQFLSPHKSGVSLLSAPPSPERAELVDGASLRKAITFLRERFDYVVLDTASTFAEHTLMALEMADHVVVPLIGDISSIRATTTALDIFQALSIPDDRIILVFNELFPKVGLSRKHIESSLHLPAHQIPFGGARLLDSVNLGSPIVSSNPENPFSQAIEELAIRISGRDASARMPNGSGDLLTKMRKRFGS